MPSTCKRVKTMTHFQDGVRVGGAGAFGDTRLPPGTVTEPGTATTPLYAYTVVPAAFANTGLAVMQTVSGAAVTLSAGPGVTTTSISGTTYYDLGVSRSVTISGQTSTTVTDFTITGLDFYQVPLTATLSGPNGFTSVSTTKTFRYVRGITAAGNTTSGVAVGTGDVFGFRYRADSAGQALLNWNNTFITASTGFLAAVTTTATATTGDVRGTYAVQSVSDGTKRLTVWMLPLNNDTVTTLYGVAQA